MAPFVLINVLKNGPFFIFLLFNCQPLPTAVNSKYTSLFLPCLSVFEHEKHLEVTTFLCGTPVQVLEGKS